MGLKLVIVDDAPFIREAVRNILRESEIQVVAEASDGNEAIEVVLREKPDLVLMDLIMPHKSGVEATKEIIEKYKSVKIIACSTESQENMVMKAIEAGCCSFIAKPFGSAELLQTLRAAVKKKPSNQ